ncbi:hypothetical protein ACHAQH_008083 [Verticillium albo-atrum]
MAEALLGLALPSRLDDAQTNKFAIHHPDQIQEQLRRVIEHKVTQTRAEHVSVTFDIRNTVQFALADVENETSAPPVNVDPALGGAPTPTPTPGGTKTVRVNDVIANQPQDDPSLQRSVATHIVELLSAVDVTSWAIRDISRGAQGWTVTYTCKDSLASWLRQYQKNPDKAIIGDYTQMDPETAIFERPAFDCRGSLIISFSKSARVISVKYDHTPLHKTVRQMAEHFRPPPPPMPAAPVETTEKPKKTPNKSKAAAEAGENGEEGASSQPKKKTPRKRKSNGDGAEGGEGSARPKKRKKKSDAAPNAPEASMIPGAPVEGTNSAVQAQTKVDEVVQSNVHSHALLNVPPAEAARRRETAIRILSEGGVEPETLSTDQFSIFANQSPELQRESLAMLAKYGAERLRIVHPKDAAASETPSGESSIESTPAAASEPAAVEQSTNGTEATGVQVSEGGKKAAKPKLTRGACTPCRSSRTKCDRTKPSCEACVATGISCEYPLQQTRGPKGENSEKPKKSQKSAARVGPEPEPEQPVQPEADDIETIDYTSNMPVANMLTPAADTSTHDYFTTASGGLSFPQMHPEEPDINPSSLSYPAPPSAVESSYTDIHAPVVPSPKERQTNGRRSLPSGPSQAASVREQTETQMPTQALPKNNYMSGWQQSAASAAARGSNSQSPTLAKQAARQHQQQPSPAVQPAQAVTPSQRSPFQVPAQTARASSRTGQRSQTPRSDQRTSTPSHHTVQQTRSPAAPPPAVAAPNYSVAADLTALSQQNPYATRYSSTADEHAGPTRLSYEPYAAQALAASSTYPSQTRYNNGNPSTSTSMSGQVSQQTATSGYTTAAAASNQSWSDAPGRKTHAYSTDTTGSSASVQQQQQQSSSLQQFDMRSASSTQQQSRPQQTYASYTSHQSQPQASSIRQQQPHEQTQSASQQQNSWYGGLGSNSSSFTPANSGSGYGTRSSGSANYGSGTGGTGSYGHQQGHQQGHQGQQHQQQQQHHGMSGMSGHGYGGAEGDIFDLLKAGMNSRSGVHGGLG